MTSIPKHRKRLDRQLIKLKMAQKEVKKHTARLETVEQLADDCSAAQQIIQEFSQQIMQNVHHQISSIVSRCLQAVFDDPYEFVIKFERKRGRTEAQLLFLRDGQEIDPLSESGIGVVDVAAFALRLSCLMLAIPKSRRLLVMDEPFRFVSAGNRQRVRQLIEQLSHELNVQIVMVTHLEELETGKVIRL